MPRQSRIDIPGTLHHVMARGIDGQDIFYDKKDFDHFLMRLDERFRKSDNACFAWALMKNHFHLLLRTGNESLSNLMRRLLTGHAVYFNRRHKRTGHLFQNRFKSILCQEDTYFLQLVRYIHLNPIRSGIVKTIKTLNKYPYAGHAYLVGELKNAWQDDQYTLQWFGKKKKKSRIDYLEYIREGISEGKRDDLMGGGLLRTAGGWKGLKELRRRGESTMGDERMLGDGSFIEEALKQNNDLKLPVANPYTIDRLSEDACNHFGVNLLDVKSASKQHGLKKVKSVICYIAIRSLKLKGKEVANHLNISPSAVSKLVTGFQADRDFQKFMKKYFPKK